MGSELSNLTAGSGETRQSMAGWSQRVTGFDVVPRPFQDTCRAVLADLDPFPYAVYAPSLSGGRHKTNPHLLAAVGDVLHIWEQRGERIAARAYRTAEVSLVEEGHVLLFSWLKLSGVTLTGESAETTVPFNTVSTAYFTPLIHRFRPQPTATAASAPQPAEDRLAFLAALNYKFLNYGRDSLLPGQVIRQVIWQAGVRRPIVALFGRALARTLILPHLTILTDDELICIGDDRRLAAVRGERYGGVWQYASLRCIADIAVDESGEWPTLSLRLAPGDYRLEKRFGAAQAPELRRLQRALETADRTAVVR